ncbi:ABC transporter ATP-binding protein [Leifsonia sp. Root112D2]|uniref:ABC transporter ATP-binding protein n=1 Tax=Leifsonia sp. Root112D2 TaxID=1736426 RepID=UPI0019101D4F|nr:ABC transporter ATP-binding protein [Leifsonia sp. Root112D2]
MRGISLTVETGQIVALLGPSGCGKTTTLRSIAGLETPTSGTITLDDDVIFSGDGIDVSPERRGIGLVFQSYALWPHMTVFENVAYGLRVARVSRAELRSRVQEALESVQLQALRDRYPSTLSGGQQQRVALARSLVMRPKLLLFDEPLSNLDMKLRESMRQELRQAMKQTGLTCVYVTHDQQEAMAIADRMIVLRDGAIAQEGMPAEIYARPGNTFVASFVGSANLLRGEVAVGGRSVRVLDAITLELDDPAPAGAGTVVIRPEWIRAARDADRRNRIRARVADVTFLGNITFYDLDAAGTSLRMQSTSFDHRPGDELDVEIPPELIRVVPIEEEVS